MVETETQKARRSVSVVSDDPSPLCQTVRLRCVTRSVSGVADSQSAGCGSVRLLGVSVTVAVSLSFHTRRRWLPPEDGTGSSPDNILRAAPPAHSRRHHHNRPSCDPLPLGRHRSRRHRSHRHLPSAGRPPVVYQSPPWIIISANERPRPFFFYWRVCSDPGWSKL